MKKIIISLLILLLSISIVSASDSPGFFKSWYGDQYGALENFWSSIWPFADDGSNVPLNQSVDEYGWYSDMPMSGLANWERQICLTTLSSDYSSVTNVLTTGLDDDGNSNIYTNTISLTAIKSLSYDMAILHELSWSITPYNNDLDYKLYLTGSNLDNYYVVGSKGSDEDSFESITAFNTESDYEAIYFDESSYEKAVIEYYSDDNPDDVEKLTVSFVIKKV